MDRLNVIVAGAGSGIGASLLSELQKKEHVYPIGFSRSGNELSEKKLESKNYSCDATNVESLEIFFKKYKNENNKLDAIYFTLGNGLFKKIEEITNQELISHFQLNVFSIFQILSLAKPLLFSSKSPFVCLVSSTAGKIGFPDSTAYSASKHAIAGLAKSLREEWKPNGIRVFTVYPGAISTEIWEGRKNFSKKDMIEPEEFAKFLASFLDLHPSINIDESYVLPIKGIL
ncbi:MAG: SDR family oxidoreductase [Leptospiraceae bacterium]|nr:SDR family oxidoreductase [Leptospiraceae bacterium]